MPDAVSGTGAIVTGAAGPAGGDGPNPAGGVYDPVADATAVFGAYAATDGNAARPAIVARADPGAGPGSLLPPPAGPDRRAFDVAIPLLLAGGIGCLTVVAFLRRRHRRRIGWGVLPDRMWPGRDAVHDGG